MNLKNYLRGLGIGIVVTSIILMVIASNNKPTMTDDEIRTRAYGLGMVDEGSTLGDYASGTEEITPTEGDGTQDDTNGENAGDEVQSAPEPTEEPTPTESAPTPEPTEEPTPELVMPNPTEAPTMEPTPSPTLTPTSTPEPTIEPEPTKAPEQKKSGSEEGSAVAKGGNFTVQRGQDSYSVAKNLESSGFISSASEFDRYLCSNGLDTKISAGDYNIPEGINEQDLARILTGR